MTFAWTIRAFVRSWISSLIRSRTPGPLTGPSPNGLRAVAGLVEFDAAVTPALLKVP